MKVYQKRAQIGKIITAIPVLIVIILIMAFFLFFSSFFSLFLGNKEIKPFVPLFVEKERFIESDGESILLKEIKFDGKKRTILEIIITLKDEYSPKGQRRPSRLDSFLTNEGLREIIEKRGTLLNRSFCFYIFLPEIVGLDQSTYPIFLYWNQNRKIVETPSALKPSYFYNPENCKEINSKENFNVEFFLRKKESEKIEIRYYFGPCEVMKEANLEDSEKYKKECMKKR